MEDTNVEQGDELRYDMHEKEEEDEDILTSSFSRSYLILLTQQENKSYLQHSRTTVSLILQESPGRKNYYTRAYI